MTMSTVQSALSRDSCGQIGKMQDFLRDLTFLASHGTLDVSEDGGRAIVTTAKRKPEELRSVPHHNTNNLAAVDNLFDEYGEASDQSFSFTIKGTNKPKRPKQESGGVAGMHCASFDHGAAAMDACDYVDG